MLTLDELVDDCRAAARSTDGAQAVAEVMRRVVSRPRDLESVLGRATEAGDTTLFGSPELTVSRLVWAPRMSMYPHDHRMWAVIAVYRGAERNLLHSRSGDRLVTSRTLDVGTGRVVLLGADVIHSVVNPTDDFSAALHVFGGDFEHQPRSEWDWETLSEQPYDEGRVQRLFDAANARAAAPGRQ
jgi:predicted metal-dependent enzyme (double-stranded beta helix superfamily)